MFFIQLIFAGILSFFLINYIIKNSEKFGLVDIPNKRSSHTHVTPRGAGIGFGLSFFVTFMLFNFSLFIQYWYLVFSIFLVYLVGILDDHRDVKATVKFYVIFITTGFLYIHDIYIDTLGYYFSYEITLWYFALPFTMFAIAGFTNALNLIDGLDGLAALISFVVFSCFAYIGYINNDTLILSISSINLACLISFLYFNWNPAKIFMGDSGSLFLGFIISLLALLSLKYVHPIAIFYLTAVPILDTLVVMIRRIRKGLSPFSPDKTHIHHILLKFFNFRVKKTILFLVILQILFSLVGMLLVINKNEIGSGSVSTFALIAFIFVVVLFYMIFTGMQRRQKLLDHLQNRLNKKNKKETLK